jgi:predicted signal transduction protein with EAL and GGDEF domain
VCAPFLLSLTPCVEPVAAEIGVSTGVATFASLSRDLPALMRVADLAMYPAKSEGNTAANRWLLNSSRRRT